MSYKNLAKAAALLAPVFLAGCVDSNYDLADMDKTLRVDVNDLVLPVNLEPIKLDEAIDFTKDTEMIQVIEDNGQKFYAFVQDGSFGTNEDIELARVTVPSVIMAPNPTNFHLNPTQSIVKRETPLSPTFEYKMEELNETFKYESSTIPKELSEVSYVGCSPFKLQLGIQVSDPNGIMGDIVFKDVTLQLPKGLTTSTKSYDPETGVLTINNLKAQDGEVSVGLTVTGIKVDPKKNFNAGKLDFEGDFNITGGTVEIALHAPDGGVVTPDPIISANISYLIEGFEISSITGTVSYADPFSIDPISLSGLPTFLLDPETVIEMANPQLYLQVNNPVGNDGVSPKASLSLTALRSGDARPLSFVPNKDIILGTNAGDGPYSFVMAPSDQYLNLPPMSENQKVDYSINKSYIEFADLGSILAPDPNTGESDMYGLPKNIAVNLNLPPMTVSDFNILPAAGESAKVLPKISGNYYIMAPLALSAASTIVYKDKVEGWSGDNDDLKDLVITGLSVTADVTNNAPVAIDMKLYPINKKGDHIDNAVMSATIQAKTTSKLDMTLAMGADGKVQNLDGLDIYALLKGADGTALSPDQTVVLQNLKVKVSGYYDANFDK